MTVHIKRALCLKEQALGAMMTTDGKIQRGWPRLVDE